MDEKNEVVEMLEKRREECLFFLNKIESKYHINAEWSERDEMTYNATLLNLEAIEIKLNNLQNKID